MFSGIISDVGRISALERVEGEHVTLVVETSYNLDEIALGDSIACSGVCLTVVCKENQSVTFQVSDETLSCTTLTHWRVDDEINLERALTANGTLDGHLVLGHVDAVIEIKAIDACEESHRIQFDLPISYAHLVAEKGSVTINGVSLTVNHVEKASFEVNIIAHTWEHTNFHSLSVGSKVNMECDVIARYVARLAECQGWGGIKC